MSDRAELLHADIADHRSLREIVRDVLHDAERMIRAEIQLARKETGEELRKAGDAASPFAGAAALGLLAAACFVTACLAGLVLLMPLWLAAIIMGIMLAIGAAVAMQVGRQRMKTVNFVPQQTVQTLKDDIEWAKQRNT